MNIFNISYLSGISKLSRNDIIPILVNVLYFMSIQTIFFLFVASKQFENVLKDKLEFVKTLSENNNIVKTYFEEIKTKYVYKKDFTEIINQRNNYNNSILFIYCGIPIIIATILLLITLYKKSEREWNKVDSLSIMFVTIAYATELFLFFCVITQYIYIGDMNLIYNFTFQILM